MPHRTIEQRELKKDRDELNEKRDDEKVLLFHLFITFATKRSKQVTIEMKRKTYSAQIETLF